MTLYQFIALDEAEQAEAIWDGVLIGDREDGEHKILLYQIDAFYVEVYYHKEYNVIRRFRPFSSTNPLEPYLKDIQTLWSNLANYTARTIQGIEAGEWQFYVTKSGHTVNVIVAVRC